MLYSFHQHLIYFIYTCVLIFLNISYYKSLKHFKVHVSFLLDMNIHVMIFCMLVWHKNVSFTKWTNVRLLLFGCTYSDSVKIGVYWDRKGKLLKQFFTITTVRFDVQLGRLFSGGYFGQFLQRNLLRLSGMLAFSSYIRCALLICYNRSIN